MNRFNLTIFTLFLAAVVWVFTWDTPRIVFLKSQLVTLFSPFIRTGAAVQNGIEKINQPELTPEQIKAEHARLSDEIEGLRVIADDYRRMQDENIELRRMLDFQRSHPMKLISARILTRNSATWWNTATIDRGESDGLATDAPVRTAEGLVGKVIQIYPHTAEILFISDESCKVVAKIEGSPDEGILSGVRGISGRTPDLRITFLPRNAKMDIGAKVYTAGKQGGVFPPNILIGEVTQFTSEDDGGVAIVRPAVDFDKIKAVFVIARESEPAEAKTPPPPSAEPVSTSRAP
jgi:rod shape-determining protein MreC